MINSVSVRNIKKPALDRIIVSVKDERIYFTRGATLIYGLNRTLCEIPSYSRQLTYASRHRILSLLCNLQPFTVPSAAHLADCISTRLSPSRTLCARITALISASTVYYTKLFYKLPHTYIFVKHFFQILLFTFFLIPYHPAVYFDIIPVETSS